jgi:hypothetical protein
VAKGTLNWTGPGAVPWNTACSGMTGQGGWTFTPTYSYVLGLKGEQVTELTVSGSAGSYSSAWEHTNVFGGLGLLATYAWSDTANQSSTYFALNDWLGTRRAEVGAEGCVSTFTSMPYGNDLLAGAPGPGEISSLR